MSHERRARLAIVRPGRAAVPRSHGVVRAVNQQVVLDALLHGGPRSRAGLARHTGLSKPTVSAVVRDLEACGLVRERGRQTGSVGRSSALYEMNPHGGYVFAVDVGGTKVRAGLANLYGEVATERVEATTRGGGDAVVAQVGALCRALAAEVGIDGSLLLAAGVSLPGVIDPAADRVSAAFNVPGLDLVAPIHAIEAALGVPVVVANDVNLAAVGERWRGRAVGIDDFVALSIGTGIGAGIIAGGELYLGASGGAGEVGFLPFARDPFDPAHHVGGPFEASAAGPRMLDALIAALAAGRASTADPGAGVPGIFEAAEAGDALAIEIVDAEARWIGLAIAAITAVLDPRLVVLGGGVGSNPGLLGPVRREVARLLPRPVPVEASGLDDRGPFVGAVAVALQVAREQLLLEARGDGMRPGWVRAAARP